MLEGLVGNKNVQKILLFLFVNGKCYGAQLKRLLHSPLTPIQKALLRLENGGIILSHYEGKTRLYQFNPAYPLLHELELLLKKAYALLPIQEKKQYAYVTLGKATHKERPLLHAVWKRLCKVKQLTFHATSKSSDEGGWNGKGKGQVQVTKVNDNVLIFQEKGFWQDRNGQDIAFHNSFRWTLDAIGHTISLEHLRHGIDHPVFLFHLVPSTNQSLASLDSHLCEKDAYFGQIFCDRHTLRLHWRVIGPKKNEEIATYYT